MTTPMMFEDGIETLGRTLITGDGGNNHLFGTDGADKIEGLGGDDTVSAGDGNDIVLGGAGNDDLMGGVGSDKLYGGGGDDNLIASDGGSDAELLSGGAGDDNLHGGSGDDLFDGGNGVDIAWFAGSIAVRVDLRLQGEAQDTGLGQDTLVGVEGVIGSSLGDRLTGDEHDNLLEGRGGNDVLAGNGGDDLLIIGGGDSRIVGGAGTDTVEVDVTIGFTADLNIRGAQELDPDVGTVDLKGVENLSASIFEIGDDILIGDGHANVLAGSSGRDLLQGGGGDDLLLGQGSSTGAGVFDWWNGLAGADTLEGGAGNDILAGAGELTGGAGADLFVFFVPTDLGSNQLLGTIHDLTRNDTIDLSRIDADAGKHGDQAFHLVAHFTGHAGQMTATYDEGTDTTTFMMDVSGAAAADIELKVDGDVAGFATFVL